MSATAAEHLDRHVLAPDSAWLAAYALGLAYSSNDQEQQIDLVREAADGRADLLDLARRRLDTTEVPHAGLREAAQQLLHGARNPHRTCVRMASSDDG